MIFTSLPSGHGRSATELTAALLQSEPSVANRIFISDLLVFMGCTPPNWLQLPCQIALFLNTIALNGGRDWIKWTLRRNYWRSTRRLLNCSSRNNSARLGRIPQRLGRNSLYRISQRLSLGRNYSLCGLDERLF